MATRSLYLIGHAGAGKSTFMGELLAELGVQLGPLVEIAGKANVKKIVYLRGHYTTDGEGLYIGRMRDYYPGTDGLERTTSPVGDMWLRGDDPKPRWIISEGNTLATEAFLHALHDTTAAMVMHLFCDSAVLHERFAARGSTQKESFVTNTATRSRNLATKARAWGGLVLPVDTGDRGSWDLALDLALAHVLGR